MNDESGSWDCLGRAVISERERTQRRLHNDGRRLGRTSQVEPEPFQLSESSTSVLSLVRASKPKSRIKRGWWFATAWQRERGDKRRTRGFARCLGLRLLDLGSRGALGLDRAGVVAILGLARLPRNHARLNPFGKYVYLRDTRPGTAKRVTLGESLGARESCPSLSIVSLGIDARLHG